jgi:hypothetical protein
VELCKYHKLTSAKITIACDNISALKNSLDPDTNTTIYDPDFDLIIAIKRKMNESRITWQYRHVYGHQDENKEKTDLDRWDRLNIEMDTLAKYTLSQPYQSSTQHIQGEPWSIWINNDKIIKHCAKAIYNHIHGKIALDYWMKKEKITEVYCSLIDWDTIGKAMNNTNLPRRWFISKHSSGMCGVGKFIALWKDTETANCPWCGQFEDASHVWKCQSIPVQLIWDSQLEKLQS